MGYLICCIILAGLTAGIAVKLRYAPRTARMARDRRLHTESARSRDLTRIGVRSPDDRTLIWQAERKPIGPRERASIEPFYTGEALDGYELRVRADGGAYLVPRRTN